MSDPHASTVTSPGLIPRAAKIPPRIQTSLAINACRWVLVIVAAVGFAGCSSSRTVSMSAVQPAAIGFPADVRKIVIVDRTASADARAGTVESILTGEAPDEDRAGLQAMVRALRDQLAETNRFETIVASEVLPGSGLGSALPAPLDWSRVDALTRSYGADAVLSIEIFDSDFIITRGRRLTKKTITENNQSREIEVPEFYAQGVSNVTIGIRVYDPRRRDIADEELYRRSGQWEAAAANIVEALTTLIDKAEATRRLGREVGVDYAGKISPMPTRVRRTFYGKSKHVPEMEQGGRYADIADWEGAIAIWEQGLTHAPTREAGQLCFNIAVAHEVLGDWEQARTWAERSYVEFGNKDAHDYLADLRHRVRQESIASQQLAQSPP